MIYALSIDDTLPRGLISGKCYDDIFSAHAHRSSTHFDASHSA